MKILFINHFPLSGSGSGVYTLNLVNSLTRLGHECAVIFPENRSDYEKFDDIKLYPVFFNSINEGLSFNFPCFSTHPRSTFNFKDMTDEERTEYVNEFTKKIIDVFDEFNPDIVHSQHIWTLSGVAADVCENYKIPLIITCHGTDILGMKDEEVRNINWGRVFAKKGYDYSSNIITISKDNKRLLEDYFGKDDKVKFIRNGVNNHIFYKDDSISREEVLEEFNIDGDFNHIISFVGKLTELKGVDTLLKALSVRNDDKLLTLIAGDGELREDLEKMSKDLNLKNVYFLGNLSQDKLNKIYNVVDLSVVPSRKEAFGLVAAEAMMCGTPVVASNIGGLPDFVSEDVGILFNVDNINDLANSINDILSNKKEFDRNYISNKISNNYSQDKIIGDIENIYNEAIDNCSKKRNK